MLSLMVVLAASACLCLAGIAVTLDDEVDDRSALGRLGSPFGSRAPEHLGNPGDYL
jgi:hypothetical protein